MFSIATRSPFGLFDELEGSLKKSFEHFDMPLDMKKTEDNLLLSFDLPGVRKEDLDIEIKEDKLFISGTRKKVFDKSDFNEKVYGEFKRSFSLPHDLDIEKVHANFEDGVLNISIDKIQKTKPQKININ